MNMLDAASELDLIGWLRGLASAGISSFSGAIASGFGPMLVDPRDFNMQHPALALKTAAIGAAISGVVSIAKFLQTSPLPSLKHVTTMTQTVTGSGTGDGSKVIETVKETHTESMPAKKAEGDGK